MVRIFHSSIVIINQGPLFNKFPFCSFMGKMPRTRRDFNAFSLFDSLKPDDKSIALPKNQYLKVMKERNTKIPQL